MKLFDVLCIGVVLADLPLGPIDEDLFNKETTMVSAMRLTTGGDALNEAIVLARLGRRPALMGHIGADMLGDLIVSQCELEGVDHSNLKQDPEMETRINVVIVGTDGQRHFIKTQNSSSRSFREDEINYDAIKNSKAVSLASIFSSKLRDVETILKIVKTAKENQVITFADMVPMTGGETWKEIEEVLPYLDYFLPNMEEAALLTGLKEPEEAADFLLRCGVKNVGIKLGKAGCLIKNKQERFLIPAFPVSAMDTTGAGDNFAAGFITGILDGMNIKEAGMFANATAGVSTESVGATAGVKSRAQIESFTVSSDNYYCNTMIKMV